LWQFITQVFALVLYWEVDILPYFESEKVLPFSSPLYIGKIGDHIGRIKTAVLGCAWAIVGATLQASAANLIWMCSARVVSGIGVRHLYFILYIMCNNQKNKVEV
jgi:MFS family permease